MGAHGVTTADATSPLDELVCFALYSAAHATTQAYRSLLAPWNLTYPQYLVLVLLWHDDEQAVGELGRTLGLDSGTLSPLVRRMEQSGLVTRIRSTEDERVVRVSLTPAGRDLRGELAHIPGCVAESTRLTAETAPDLIDLLRRLTAGMQDTTAGVR